MMDVGVGRFDIIYQPRRPDEWMILLSACRRDKGRNTFNIGKRASSLYLCIGMYEFVR